MRGIALAALVAVTGCAQPAKQQASIASATIRMRGELVAAGQGYTFQPCGSSQARLVADRTSGDLPSLWHQLGVDAQQALFVEAVVDTAADSAVVSEIRRAAGEGRGCAESWDYEVRAHGNEPFWSITVKRDTILFEQPDEPHRIVFPYAAASSGTYRSVAAGDSLVLTLEEHRCQDGMSGFIFPLTAHARVRGRELHGCASEGAP